MPEADSLAAILSEGRRLVEYVRQDPDRLVPHYPSWTLRDLIAHVASIHARTTTICRTLPQAHFPVPELPVGREATDWFEQNLSEMIEALREVDPEAHAWTLFEDPRVGSWERRMVVETGVHRWDAQQAVEEPDPLIAVVATHGLEEFEDLWLPKLGDLPTLEVVATDLGRSWVFGTGKPAAMVSGNASDVYLRLLARPGVGLPAEWESAIDALPTPAGAS